VGIIGFGRIGREVASRLAPFKCRRVVHDPLVPAADVRALGCEPMELDPLLAASDLVTLHCPSTPKTRRILNAETIGRMRAGAILLNLGRGDLVDTAALIGALESGRLAGAALDVSDPEPIPAGSPLLAMPNVILTPHIASASTKAVRRLRETVANLAACAIRGQPLPNIVNRVKR
jgi:phosphoglycerate dehydrogenase-like enzyme